MLTFYSAAYDAGINKLLAGATCLSVCL